MTLTLSKWVYERIVSEKSLLIMHPDYFLLPGGGARDKTGSDAQPKEFNRMLRRVIEADLLPEYAR